MQVKTSLYLDEVLILVCQDYEALISGHRIIFLYNAFAPGRLFVILPQGSQRITPKYFVEIIDNDVNINDESRQLILKSLYTSGTELQIALEKIGQASLLTVRVYTFLSQTSVKYLPSLGFMKLSEPIAVDQYRPILDDHTFEQLCRNPTQPPNELAQLIPKLQTLTLTNPQAEAFIATLQAHQQQKKRPRPLIPDWITNQEIIKFGEGSIQEDDSVHAQGTRFEKIVRDAMIFLGFSVDEYHKGGAGGIDFFISKPYPIIGECKSGKSIPSDTPN